MLLGACPELQPGVRVHVVMASLMDRLSRFAAQDGAKVAAQFDAVDAFGKLKRAALRVRWAISQIDYGWEGGQQCGRRALL